jgi:hypothetical protein
MVALGSGVEDGAFFYFGERLADLNRKYVISLSTIRYQDNE